MDEKVNIPEELYEDEIVGFLADRYHTSPRNIIMQFLWQDREADVPRDSAAGRCLENNEMEILRGLMDRISH